ncbi:Heat-labile enterotoxin, A chain [Metarhizium album ARSEF 1941]|uniref:Heat-labile enterotoxin, A chain n=1 Tax=Metarhizium album (strain ARSEF 1941) TaxID=1081103 RepID=A0A0B2X5F7_METAS|nr:Heat-labile enterotoxin, A chain [Metarhizium album ARSEF 1941]KHO00998.1 Heat-labile enterotoxin, A chain [Metarhizium album ARSEF 1941]
MKTLWVSPSVWIAALVVSASGHTLPSADAASYNDKRSTESQQVSVFRGEYGRTPQQVADVGGLMSKGYARNFDVPLTPAERGWGSSLTEHISGRNKAVSLFVSTTYDPVIAMKFASGGETAEFYIYEAALDDKAIDVEKSIRKFERSYAATQKEVAFVKGIPNEQIRGHYVMRPGDYDPTTHLGIDEFKHRFADRWVPNPQFNQRYLSTKSARTQSQFDKLYKGPTTAQQEAFAKSYAAQLGKKDVQTPQSAAKALESFFKKASPSEKLLESSRPNKSRLPKMKPVDGSKVRTKPGKGPAEVGPRPGPHVPGTPEVRPKPKPVDLAPAKPKDVALAKNAEMVAAAERLSEKEFASASRRYGLKAIVEGRWNTDLSVVRSKALGRGKLSLSSPKLLPKGSKLKAGMGALGAAGIGLWIHGMVEAFTTETSDWDKAAAVTAIIPFVGCGTNLIAQAEKADANTALVAVDTGLCVLGDALLLGGVTAPLGVVVHLSRFLVQFFEPPPDLPTYQEIHAMRDKPWQAFLEEHLNKHLVSEEWRKKLEAAVAIESLGIWSKAADRVGLLEAAKATVLQTPDLSESRGEAQKAIEQVRNGAKAEILRRQRRYLLSLPQTLHEGFAKWLAATADTYNADFVRKIKSDDMVERYPSYSKVVAWMFSRQRVYAASHERMATAAWLLEGDPPPMPSLFTLAYFVGVSAGVDDPPPPRINPKGGPGFAKFTPAEPGDWKCAVDPDVIDPMLYLEEKTGRKRHLVLVRHTVAVVRLLLGHIKEFQLPAEGEGLSNVQEFQMLIAMYIGNTFADWKEIHRHKVGYIHKDFEKDMIGLMQRLYNIPRAEAGQLVRTAGEHA